MVSGAVNYREEQPSSMLAPWVECSWVLSAGPAQAPYTHRVLPDGCMDLVWSPSGGVQVAGPNTTGYLTTMPAGSSALGVRLLPGAAAALFGVAPALLLDAHLKPSELWGGPGRRLEAEVAQASTDQARSTVLVSWLEQRALSAPEPDPLVRAVARQLARQPWSVAALAQELGYSERQLHRRVVAEVGYGPKRLARVLRLRRTLSAARVSTEGGGTLSLAQVAYQNDYADQAHFTHECLALAGVTPSTLLARLRLGARGPSG